MIDKTCDCQTKAAGEDPLRNENPHRPEHSPVVAVRARGLPFLLYRIRFPKNYSRPATNKDSIMFQAKAKRRHVPIPETSLSPAGNDAIIAPCEPGIARAANDAQHDRRHLDAARQHESLPCRGMMELLSNGSVMVAGNAGPSLEQLTPSSTGSYVNGTWSPLASMSRTRLYDATKCFPGWPRHGLGRRIHDGTLLTLSNDTGEIYNPVTNTWTAIAPFPESTFGGPTMMLPNGDVLAGWRTAQDTSSTIPTANTWSPGPTKLTTTQATGKPGPNSPMAASCRYDIDADLCRATEAQASNLDDDLERFRHDAGLGCKPCQAIGPAHAAAGRSSFSARRQQQHGPLRSLDEQWTAGPMLPNGLETNQCRGAMMTNGDVLLCSMAPDYTDPTRLWSDVNIFEYNPTDNTLTDVTPTHSVSLRAIPGRSSIACWRCPAGRCCLEPPGGDRGNLCLHTRRLAQAAWQPTITQRRRRRQRRTAITR